MKTDRDRAAPGHCAHVQAAAAAASSISLSALT